MADSDPGFVLDEASGLYCHAGSGFYHDPDAGWYYNTHDGVYYTFENGTYVPMSSTDDSRVVISEPQDSPPNEGSPFSNSDGKGHMLPTTQETGTLDIHEGQSGTELSLVDAGKGVQEGDELEGAQLVDHGISVQMEDEYPLWYFDTVRSMYWYYDKESRAYYLYQGENNNSAEEVGADEIAGSQEGDTRSEGPITYVPNSEGLERVNTEESSPQQENVETFQPTSGWVEEALIELYLKGYPQESSSRDEGPWITSADIFNESPQSGSYHARSGFSMKPSYPNGTPGFDDQMWSACRNRNSTQELQVPSNDSDNDGSEELEEGEWVPDEPLRIVDGEEGEVCSFDGKTREEEENRFHSQLCVASDEYLQSPAEFQDYYNENGEALKHTETDDVDMEEGEISLVDEQQKEEEQWQAQYGQVVREKARDYLIPGAVDLWDWTVIDKESKTPKQGKLKKQLVGRIVSSVTRLHPSLSGTSGLIRTSAVKAAELDFVKVSSGKIYRLRRPSRKHLAAVGTYDSSNPTKDFGLPAIGLAALDTTEDKATTGGSAARLSDQTKGRADSFSKPFIPNTGHWRFQRLLATKKGRGVPAALMASRYLSPEEMLISEQRKQRYRDRAAERRNLHGGFGVGPGQKGVSVVEQEKLEADEAVGMAGALEKAAAAPPLGRENVGKRMLEGMGWKEGQTLGLEGGLVKPLQAQGNVGRAGLGWGE